MDLPIDADLSRRLSASAAQGGELAILHSIREDRSSPRGVPKADCPKPRVLIDRKQFATRSSSSR